MVDTAERADPVVMPRWQVQPWIIKASLFLCVALAAFSAFGAQRQEAPPPTTIYVPSTQPITSLTREDVQRLRAYVDALLEQAHLNQQIRRQLREVRDFLDGVGDGEVSIAPEPDPSPSSGSTPAPPTTRPASTTTTTTTEPPPPTTQPSRIDLNQLIDDVLGS